MTETTTLIPAPFASVNGTSLQGYVNASYRDLVAAFGEPARYEDDKVQAEWVLRTADGVAVTVYDWKTYAPVETIREWNVGGFDVIAVDVLRAAGFRATLA
jgi:hypothetical protein